LVGVWRAKVVLGCPTGNNTPLFDMLARTIAAALDRASGRVSAVNIITAAALPVLVIVWD